jgi:5-methylcytosine-specific restriction enzyme A
MPSAAKRPCLKPGCGALVSAGYCAVHRLRSRRSDEAKTWHKLYDARWQRYRISHLADHPLCAECERGGRLMPASIVDHIVPHRGDVALFWDPANHQAMCKACHDTKTATEDGGFGTLAQT